MALNILEVGTACARSPIAVGAVALSKSLGICTDLSSSTLVSRAGAHGTAIPNGRGHRGSWDSACSGCGCFGVLLARHA